MIQLNTPRLPSIDDNRRRARLGLARLDPPAPQTPGPPPTLFEVVVVVALVGGAIVAMLAAIIGGAR